MKRWFNMALTSLKLVALMIGETLFVGLPVASLAFWICYLGDCWWGEHILVKNADRLFTVCNITGLICGVLFTIYATRKTMDDIRGNKAPNQEVK